MRIVFFIVALLALVFWGFSGFDMWAMLTGWQPYADLYGADMLAWIQDFPIWRKAIWGASIGLGVIGALMMLARVRGAGPMLLLAWLLMASGFAYDVVVQEGARSYGPQGVIAHAVSIVLAALFAWAGFAATSKSAKAALVAPSSPAKTVTAPSSEPTTLALPAVEVAPALTPSEAEPAPTEAPPAPGTPAPAEGEPAPTTDAAPTPTEATPAPIEPPPLAQTEPASPLPESPALSAPESASQDVAESVDRESGEHPQPASEDRPGGG